MIKIDHFYVKVTDLDKAITFYQNVLEKTISHKEGNRWADFDSGEGVYFGIFNASHDRETFEPGDNVTLALKTQNIENEYKRITDLNPKTITEIIHLSQPYNYSYFQFEDEWGNIWEVAQYIYNE